MLPKFLQSSYTRYKDDTNSLATWLLDAASKCGHRPEDLISIAPPLTKGENKSKSQAAKAPSDLVQYTTTVKDLQALAEVVVKSDLTVPQHVLTIAKRAIKLRKQVTSWFLGQGDTENNEGHAHFISALERICETLEKTNKSSNKQPPPTSDTKDDDADLDMFMNKFAVLTVEEPQEAQQTQGASPKPQKIVKVELDENDEDEATDSSLRYMLFKALCLFQDLHNMRAFISQTWSEYRDKKIDLMNAALVTDGALQLARDLVQEVTDEWDYSTHSSHETLQDLVCMAVRTTRGITSTFESGLPYDERMADVAELCYLTTWTLLEVFARVLENDHPLVVEKGWFGTYDPKANRDGMSLVQKYNEDKILLLEVLPEFSLITTFGIRMLTPDSITSGLLELCNTKKVDLWLCFASQILLDVHHIMRHSTLSAFEDLRMSGLRIQKTIDDYLNISKTHPQPKFWPKGNDDEIKKVRLDVDTWIIKDILLELRRLSFPGNDALEKNVLLSQHSILCGLIMFYLNTRMQYIGLRLVSQWFNVQQMAFLYNLVNIQYHKNLNWPDMETVIKIHGESHMFIGSRPKNASESLRRLELASGFSSAAKFARDSRKKRDFPKKTRALTPTTTIANMFRAQYAPCEADDDIGSIAKVLDKLSQETCPRSTSEDLQPSNSQRIFHQKWSRTRNISPLKLLALLKSRLAEEEPVILFNYFGMHKRSIELLRLIKEKEDHGFVQCFGIGYMHDETWITYLVDWIHQIAQSTEKHWRGLGISRPVSAIVMSCGDVMQEYLQRNGDVACKELRIFCKNKKPIQNEIDYYDKDKSEELRHSFSLGGPLDPKVVASLQTGIPIA